MNPPNIGTRAVHIETRGATIDMPFAARSRL
jgi:hypothetical protein